MMRPNHRWRGRAARVLRVQLAVLGWRTPGRQKRLMGQARTRWREALGLWCWSGGDFFDADGIGPLGDERVTIFHRQSCILNKHLRALATTPDEIVEEVLPADAVRAGWGIYSCFAAFNEAGQIVHSILPFRSYSMQDGWADYQPL